MPEQLAVTSGFTLRNSCEVGQVGQVGQGGEAEIQPGSSFCASAFAVSSMSLSDIFNFYFFIYISETVSFCKHLNNKMKIPKLLVRLINNLYTTPCWNCAPFNL